uniref:Inositol 2-dehydrogenase-like n=1 Tax=Geotrypetes seraphini TaxID=260995 RepID=A0A6P8PU58_GEOSA|nr:inositol 2-dehydrogenase-like [Geotrypetes seraphini]
MGRKKKTLHDYAAEFTDLAVKRHLMEHKESGETSLVETLYCKSCELPMRVRRDRILEHLASGRHYRNRRLIKSHGGRTPLLLSPGSELSTNLPLQLDHSSLLSQPSYILPTNHCSTSTSANTSCTMVPSPSSYHHQPLMSVHPNAISSTTSAMSAREDQTPSTSTSHPTAFSALHVRSPHLPGKQTNQRLVVSEASNSVVSGGTGGRYSSGSGVLGSRVGLAIFGVGQGSSALLQSLMEENGCYLLYVVENQLPEAERSLGSKFLANTRVLREQDADIVLNDQRVSGVIICSPPEAASDIVLDALRAGKGVLCDHLLSLDRQTAEACFDEADRCGKPLVCGFYKRFDPAVRFLYNKVRDNQALGRIHRISVVSRMFPAVALNCVKKSGGIFYTTAVHDIDLISWLLGESAPDTIFSLGHAFCADVASLKDADTITISMKFASGAIVSLDISQHCTKSCDQRLEIHGSQGTLRVDNQNPLGITEHGTSVSLFSQTHADRYREAYRQLFQHFLQTVKGKESPVVTKEQFLWAIQVAAAAEQSWQNGSAVDLRNEAVDVTVIKTEIL